MTASRKRVIWQTLDVGRAETASKESGCIILVPNFSIKIRKLVLKSLTDHQCTGMSSLAPHRDTKAVSAPLTYLCSAVSREAVLFFTKKT